MKTAQSFDLYGVKLYASAADAVAAVAKLPRFKTTPNVTNRQCASDQIDRDNRARASETPGRVMTHLNCISKITYQGPQERLQLGLVEDVPDQPNCTVIGSVTYEQEKQLTNDADEARLRSQWEKKYGPLENQSTVWGDSAAAHVVMTRSRDAIVIELADPAFMQHKEEVKAKLVADADEKGRAEAKAKAKASRKKQSF